VKSKCVFSEKVNSYI